MRGLEPLSNLHHPATLTPRQLVPSTIVQIKDSMLEYSLAMDALIGIVVNITMRFARDAHRSSGKHRSGTTDRFTDGRDSPMVKHYS
jgi:hypothetical protein